MMMQRFANAARRPAAAALHIHRPTAPALHARLQSLAPNAACRNFSKTASQRLAAPKNPKRINIELNGGFVSFDHIFLRDACPCPKCLHPSTRQKLFQTTDIPYNVKPSSVEQQPDGSHHITWAHDIPIPGANPPYTHKSVYTAEFLQRYSTLRNRVRARHNVAPQVLWDGKMMANKVLYVDYDDYMLTEEGLYKAVKQLQHFGLMFIKGIPEGKHDAVEGIAERIGNLKNTFYGKTWDVKSVKNSKNIAYTSLNLGHHMDLLYFESPPGLQFLHSIQNSTTGGESLFADSFRAATLIRMDAPELFRALTRFPVTYHYENDGQHYHYTRPTIVLDENSYLREKRISHVNWAPPFQAPFEVDIGQEVQDQFRQYILAAKAFAEHVDAPASQFELRLEEGVCAVFFNRRILHSRRAFDASSGDRWLKGTYVDIDAFNSKYRTLTEKFHTEEDDTYSYIK